MSDHREFDELAALYALDALELSDRARFEGHLATGCDRCLSSVRDARRVADELLGAIGPSRPDERVRQELMMRARRASQSQDRRESG